MANILIVEDEHSLRELLAFNLESEGYNVIEAGDANEALMYLEELEPDLILLDIMLPGLKGTHLLNILKGNEKTVDIPVVIISARDDEEMIVQHLEAGAVDYITKPFSIRVLMAKVRQLIKKGSGRKNLFSYKNIELDDEEHKVYVNKKEVFLTHKEFELLRLFVRHPGRVYTRNQLLTNIWGYDSDVYTRTVDAHISSLRKKLGEVGELIKTVPKIGYKME